MKLNIETIVFFGAFAVVLQANTAAAAPTAGFDALSQNLTIIYNAMERTKASLDYAETLLDQRLIEDYLLVHNANPSYDHEAYFNISKYLAKVLRVPLLAAALYENERVTLQLTLEQMPSSFKNIFTRDEVCIKNRHNNEYLAIYKGDEFGYLNVVTIGGSSLQIVEHSKVWKVNPWLNGFVEFSNDAFRIDWYRSLLYNKQTAERNKAQLYIALESLTKLDDLMKISWTLHPKSNAFLIENSNSAQYLCLGDSQDVQNNLYRQAFIVSTTSAYFYEPRCMWEFVDCNGSALENIKSQLKKQAYY